MLENIVYFVSYLSKNFEYYWRPVNKTVHPKVTNGLSLALILIFFHCCPLQNEIINN